MTDLELVKAIQKMVAVVTIGPSALRGQGAPGVISAARDFLANLDLHRFSLKHCAHRGERDEPSRRGQELRYQVLCQHSAAFEGNATRCAERHESLQCH